ncbi:MAG TPA: hypothetical protein VEC60_07670 [Reyranella sp.]|nr:hypothetical protein [Reyranella sp.]
MRQVGILLAATMLAGTVGACADPYYGYRTRTYAYTSDYYYPNYYSSRPVYYSSAPVYYSSPYYRSAYSSHWDYYRNYRGIHSSPELSSM